MRKTIKNVTMVVPVLIVSCHPLENLNNGPEAPQAITISSAAANAPGEPIAREEVRARRWNVSAYMRLCSSWMIADVAQGVRDFAGTPCVPTEAVLVVDCYQSTSRRPVILLSRKPCESRMAKIR